MASNHDLDEPVSGGNLDDRMAATISSGGLDSKAGRLIAHHLVGGDPVATDLGNDKPGEIDILVSADASINTSELAARVHDLAVNSYKANGNNGTRAGLVGSVRGSNINKGPALDPDVEHLIIESFGELDSDYRAAFKEVLDARSYTFTTDSVREEVSAPGANLFIGNPSYGNFDKYQPIGEQIPAEPAIISGVDVVVTALGEQPPTAEPLEGKLAKSVVREARSIKVEWSEEATEAYRAVISKLESRDPDEDELIRVQPSRASEAIRKLSESAAKYRFSDEVTREDVRRSWDLLASAYADMGVHLKEQSEFKREVDHSSIIRGKVQDLEGGYDEGAPEQVVINEAMDSGLSRSEAEQAVEEAKQKALIYEPRTDHFRST